MKLQLCEYVSNEFFHVYLRLCNRDSVDVHYDPSRQDHAKFEEEMENPQSLKDSIGGNKITSDVLEKDRITSQEKFYSVSNTLKGFFGDKNQVL